MSHDALRELREERLVALLILVDQFQRAKKDPATREAILQLYLANLRRINNWDLVDLSAPDIVGGSLLEGGDRRLLDRLAASRHAPLRHRKAERRGATPVARPSGGARSVRPVMEVADVVDVVDVVQKVDGRWRRGPMASSSCTLHPRHLCLKQP